MADAPACGEETGEVDGGAEARVRVEGDAGLKQKNMGLIFCHEHAVNHTVQSINHPEFSECRVDEKGAIIKFNLSAE